MTKKRKLARDISNREFDQENARIIKKSPREFADFHSQVVKRAEDIEEDVEKHFADIKKGDRKFKRPFRP